MADTSKICVGRIAGAHGIRGQVRLQSFTEDPEAIAGYSPLTDDSGKDFQIKLTGVVKDAFIATVIGVADRNGAEALKGTRLYIPRAILPETEDGTYYDADLIGLAAIDQDGKDLGKIMAIHDFGAGPLIEFGVKGRSFTLPFNDDYVPEVDVDGGKVELFVPEGWLTEEKPPRDKPKEKAKHRRAKRDEAATHAKVADQASNEPGA